MKTAWLILCAIVLGFVASSAFGVVGFFVGAVSWWVMFYVCKAMFKATTSFLDFLTASDFANWIALSFSPWLVASVVWCLVFVVMAK